MTEKRDMLRHFLATLAYRAKGLFRDIPESILEQRPGKDARTPREILNHVNGVLTYAHSFLVRYDSTELVPGTWELEVSRYYEILEKLDTSIRDGIPLREITEEQLLQGPFSDAMWHLGQISAARNAAGCAVPSENYVFAPIHSGASLKPDEVNS